VAFQDTAVVASAAPPIFRNSLRSFPCVAISLPGSGYMPDETANREDDSYLPCTYDVLLYTVTSPTKLRAG
jgi:hypothetical protein